MAKSEVCKACECSEDCTIGCGDELWQRIDALEKGLEEIKKALEELQKGVTKNE